MKTKCAHPLSECISPKILLYKIMLKQNERHFSNRFVILPLDNIEWAPLLIFISIHIIIRFLMFICLRKNRFKLITLNIFIALNTQMKTAFVFFFIFLHCIALVFRGLYKFPGECALIRQVEKKNNAIRWAIELRQENRKVN